MGEGEGGFLMFIKVVIQRRIEQEGRLLVSAVEKFLEKNNLVTAGENSALSESPERQWFEGLKGRWHELWIRSLSVILGIGARVNPQQLNGIFALVHAALPPDPKRTIELH
ncbi:unnamed protein product [Enterobius vermicularis]|uniref:Uncharacterized protein n=1 Tax=Enterobius vermicularis TaxID=51028 RepID=A0A0N4UXL0_ENTVE|nr:unnamed protein product [Enterobius vermicularis]